MIPKINSNYFHV